MLNGITNAAACCAYTPEGENAGYGVTDTKSVTVGGVQVNVPRNAKGLLSQIGEALDKAIHGGDNYSQARNLTGSAARVYRNGANVIPFPMVNPFKPVLATRAPVTALNRFPNRFTYKVESVGSEPDDEESSFNGLSGLGYSWADFNPGFPTLESSRPSKLQTILGTIQGTLPATIQAFRANPSNIYPGTAYNPYTTNYPGATYPGTPQGTGNAAEDVGAGVGRAADTLGGTLSRFVAEHPYLVIGGGAALVLLFMNPPRRR